MFRCEHDPVFHSAHRQAEPEVAQVKCAKCGLATPWVVPSVHQADVNHPWQLWAALMAKESAATHEAKDAASAEFVRAQQVVAERASCWDAFCAGYGTDPSLRGPAVAKAWGADLRRDHNVYVAVSRVMRGLVTPERIYQTFGAFRKASQAYLANGNPQAPETTPTEERGA